MISLILYWYNYFINKNTILHMNHDRECFFGRFAAKTSQMSKNARSKIIKTSNWNIYYLWMFITLLGRWYINHQHWNHVNMCRWILFSNGCIWKSITYLNRRAQNLIHYFQVSHVLVVEWMLAILSMLVASWKMIRHWLVLVF